MVNTKKLFEKIDEHGKKKRYLAEKCGLSPQGFYNCCNNLAEFKASHMNVLREELKITTLKDFNAIFFWDGVAPDATEEVTS